MKELRVYLFYTYNAFQQVLINRLIMVLFLLGKSIRIILFLIFLTYLFSKTQSVGGYTRSQIVFFYLSFNLIDTLSQFLFREVYRFRSLIISGSFDFVLLKPINPLIRVLLGGGDLMDLVMLFLLGGTTVYYGVTNLHPNLGSWIIFFLMIFAGLLIAAAFHIFVLGLGVITTSVDHLIMVYRDLTSLLRIPIDLYAEPIRSLLTFVIPLGIMITFPAKTLMGILSLPLIIYSFSFAFIFFYLSLVFWRWSLKEYQSAGG